MKSKVSIIIPTFNRAHLICETLDSILAQTYLNWECIVVDDGSTDNTAEILEEYINKDNRFGYYQRPNERAKGANSCRNFGFESSFGEFIQWFDSDDIMDSDLLKRQLESINNDFDCSVCKIEHYDFENRKVLQETKILSQNLIQDYLIGNVTFYVSGPLWKRSFLDKQKVLFDEEISNLDDWDFNLRMFYNNPKIKYINKALIKYRIHANSLSQEIEKLNFSEIQSEFKARRKHLLYLMFNKKLDTMFFKKFIVSRNKYYLREALLLKNNCSLVLFKNLLLTQFLLCDIKGFTKSLFGYIGLKFFRKGYSLLK